MSLLLTPSVSMAYARSGMLSATGRCRAFDSAANGYVRSEAVGAARSGRAPALKTPPKSVGKPIAR